MSNANKIAAPATATSVPARTHQIAKQSFGFLHGVLLRSHRNGQAGLTGSVDHVDSSHLAPAGAIGSYTDRHVSSPDLEVPVLVPPRSLDHLIPLSQRSHFSAYKTSPTWSASFND